MTHSPTPRVPLFCSYHILTSSVIYYWTDALQHGIYLLNRNTSGSLGEWEMLWEDWPQASVSTAFSSSPKLSRVFLYLERNTEYMYMFSFRNHRDEKRENNTLTLSKCKFSLLAPSLRQQRALVLCLHRVIQTRFLTNRRACFLRIVF